MPDMRPAIVELDSELIKVTDTVGLTHWYRVTLNGSLEEGAPVTTYYEGVHDSLVRAPRTRYPSANTDHTEGRALWVSLNGYGRGSWPISEGVAATMCELPHLCGDLKPGEQCQACGDRGPEMKVCKCCGMPVRFVSELDEYFHINGFRQLETIAREVTDKKEVSQL
jgi:hypothetical protein